MHYLLLFTSALLAATLIPAQSEAVLIGLILNEQGAFWLLIAVATLGNTLGSVINWWLGRYLEYFHDKRWFPVKAAMLERAQRHFQRYGWGAIVELVARGGRSVDVSGGGDANAVAAVFGSGSNGEGRALFAVGVDGGGISLLFSIIASDNNLSSLLPLIFAALSKIRCNYQYSCS